jgi:uncharacterized protein
MRPGFDWDNQKAQLNWRKHRISFEEASTVFSDPLAISFPDPDHSEKEERWVIIGMSMFGRTLMVIHLERAAVIRIISARRADRRERREYEEGEFL